MHIYVHMYNYGTGVYIIITFFQPVIYILFDTGYTEISQWCWFLVDYMIFQGKWNSRKMEMENKMI